MDDDFIIRENMKYVKTWVDNLLVRPPFISFRFCEDAQKRKNRLFQITFQSPMTYPKGNYGIHIPLYLDNKTFVEEINHVWPAFRDLAFECKDKLGKESKIVDMNMQTIKKDNPSQQFKSMSDIAIEIKEKASNLQLDEAK
jgi:hypothetical protein